MPLEQDPQTTFYAYELETPTGTTVRALYKSEEERTEGLERHQQVYNGAPATKTTVEGNAWREAVEEYFGDGHEAVAAEGSEEGTKERSERRL